jgi:putative DNA primase/helicase
MRQTLQEHMQANIGIAIDSPIIDGRWHNGKRKAGKVGYVGHYLPKGILVRYHHHKTKEVHVWKEWEGKSDHLSDDEYQRRRTEAAAKAREAAKLAQQAKTDLLAKVQTVFSRSKQADIDAPYITKKLIVPIGARKVMERVEIVPATATTKAQYIAPTDVLIPIYDQQGLLQGIQQITDTGYKLIRGTLTDGLLWIGGDLTTGEIKDRLYIAEGYATAVTVHMRTRNPVLVAFSTTNLLSVGQWARDRYPETEIIYAVDNDIGKVTTAHGQQIENAGKYYATQAAKVIGAGLATPPTDRKADWNDWHISQITATKKPD